MRLLILIGLVAAPVFAQSWNSNAGGWNTGYGTVYGSFGYAMATQQIYQTTQMQIQRLANRQMMIKQFGLAAVEKAEREAAAGKAPPPTQNAPQVTAPPPASKNLGRFKPEKKGSGAAQQLADAIGSTAEEKKFLIDVQVATKQAFESQPETGPWKNNVAGALAFFMLSNLVVANDSAEPSDATSQAVFQAFNLTVDETPELAKATNKEKQQLYEALVGFTALPLAIYTDAKERGDAQQLAQAQELARNLLQLVLKIDAKTVKLPQ
jgi:hypothetical protein